MTPGRGLPHADRRFATRPRRPPFQSRRSARAPYPTLALLAAVLAGAGLLLFAAAAHAQKRGPKVDLFWTHPQFAGSGVHGIALLPVSTFDHSVAAERAVAQAWGQQYQGAGYRWMSPLSATALMRVAGGDSLIKSVDRALLDLGRADSLQAPFLCAKLHVQALLTLRVDRWEQVAIEVDQRGKPFTTVGLTAALVDSAGRLLWRGSGTETVEGLEHVPIPSAEGERTGEKQLTTRRTGSPPPAYAEVLIRLLARWGDQFPSRAARTAPDSARAK